MLPPGELRVELADAATPEDANITGDLDVLRDLVIRGAGAGATTIRAALPAGHPDRVLDLIGAGIDLQVADLTVTGGAGERFGGGIRSGGDGELSLERVVVRGNGVNGMAADGYGGGVYKGPGRLVMRDTSVLANTAVAPGFGGGIFLAGPTTAATLTNVTIAGNSAKTIGGGVATNGAALGELTHVTIVENRAGVQEGGIGSDASALRLRSSIVSANIAPTDPNCGTIGFAPASDGGNVGDRQTAVAAAARRRAPAGTVVRYTLSETAKITLRIERALRGRRVGGRCLKSTRARRLRPQCTSYVAIKPTLRRRAQAGANRLAFSGRIGRRALRPGRYRAVLRATDDAGNRSALRTLAFQIVR